MVLWRLELGANLSNFELAGFVMAILVLILYIARKPLLRQPYLMP